MKWLLCFLKAGLHLNFERFKEGIEKNVTANYPALKYIFTYTFLLGTTDLLQIAFFPMFVSCQSQMTNSHYNVKTKMAAIVNKAYRYYQKSGKECNKRASIAVASPSSIFLHFQSPLAPATHAQPVVTLHYLLRGRTESDVSRSKYVQHTCRAVLAMFTSLFSDVI